MKKRLFKVLFVLIAVTGCAGIALQWVARSQVSPERLVARLEAAHNCRAEVDFSEVRLFSWPALVEIRGLRMVPRDAVAAAGTPLAQRTPVAVAETMIAADRLVLEMNPWALLTGNLEVKRLLLDRPDIRGVRGKKGEKSLEALMAKPAAGNQAGLPVAAMAAAPVPAVEAEEEGDEAAAVPAEPFRAADLPFAASLEEVRIRNGSYQLRNDKKRTVTEVRDFTASLTGVRIDPGNLATANEATVSAGCRMMIDNRQLGVRTLDLLLTLDGKVQPFNPATGLLSDDMGFEVVARQGSVVNRIPTLVRLAERLEKLKKDIGLALELPAEGVLTRDTVVKAAVRGGRLVVTEGVLFAFDTYRIKLDADSWLSLADEQHRFEGRLQGSTEVSRKALAGVDEFFRKKDARLAEIVRKNILTKITSEKGLLSIPFESTGEIGHPEVDFSVSLRKTLNDALRDVAKDLLLDAASGGDALQGAVDTLLDGFLKKKDQKKEESKP